MDEKRKKENNQRGMTESIYCTIRTAYAEDHISLDNLKELVELTTELYNRKKEEAGGGE